MTTAGVFTWSETQTKSVVKPYGNLAGPFPRHTSASASAAEFPERSLQTRESLGAASNAMLSSEMRPQFSFTYKSQTKLISSEKYLFGVSWTLFHRTIWTF